ncbi:MAG: flavin reductase [Bacteroidia bacterium]|nr:flavin reductase [Bacteroidia bacterium]
MKQFSVQNINDMDYLYRINLINSCSGFKSANLLGTKSGEGKSNVAVFSSVTHIGSNPPLLGFFLRPTTVMRNTYENIKETKVFTVNHIHEPILEDAHHTSAKYAKQVSEFDMTNLEEEYINDCYAPFVKGVPVKMALKYIEEHPVKANSTILVVGQITELYIDESILQPDGFIDLTKAKVSAINGLDAYTTPVLKTRLSYQRPKPETAKK